MKVAVTGSHGLVGAALIQALRRDGIDVTALVRNDPGPGEALWDPGTGAVSNGALDGAEAVVHLAGAGIADRRWTTKRKNLLVSSRVQATEGLVGAMARANPRPSVLVSASAVGIYGDRADEILDETSSLGEGFLARLCMEWEEAALAAQAHGARVACVRSGIVLSSSGGVLAKQLPIFKAGLGGPIGRGSQWVSWISLDDEIGLIRMAIDSPSFAGPVNATAPFPVTNTEFTQHLAAAVHRPARLGVPPFALAAVFGKEAVTEFLTASQRALPSRALGNGYAFRYEHLEGALAALLP